MKIINFTNSNNIIFVHAICHNSFTFRSILIIYDTGWGNITSLNFKVNNKKTIRDIEILFLDFETTTWEV